MKIKTHAALVDEEGNDLNIYSEKFDINNVPNLSMDKKYILYKMLNLTEEEIEDGTLEWR